VRTQRYELACGIDDGIETLEYWRARRERLPWRRRSARREADLMIDNWERRLRSAVLRDPRLSVAERLDAGLLVLRTRGSILARRWRWRAQVAVVAVAGAFTAMIAGLAGLLF
jgi:hypothetical protein